MSNDSNGFWDDDEDDDFDLEEHFQEQERVQIERHIRYANNCVCGAWQFDNKWHGVQVADCMCGVE